MNIIFFGTPTFSAEVLTYLLSHGLNMAAVVTKPDKPVGRSLNPVPVPVKAVALAHQIPVYQPELVSAEDFAPILKAYNPDLFVVVAYGEILKTHLLEMPKIACINMHTSLLPKYRGAGPIQRAIINGETETGVTLMHMAKKMDAGDIIETVHVPITLSTTYGELEKSLCQVGSELLCKVIQDLKQGIVKRVPQDHSQATFAPKIELNDCEINWNQPALAVHNLIRGVNPEPGAWGWLNVQPTTKRLKVFTSLPSDVEPEMGPGNLFNKGKEGIFVRCQQGSVQLLEVQLEGKKRMQAQDLFRGLPNIPYQFSSLK